jgi:hypothetical protein
MRIARCIPRATNTHPEYAALIAFYGNNDCSKATQYYVIPTLPVLFLLESAQNGSDAGGRGGRNGRDVKLTTDLRKVPRLSMSGSIPLLPLYAFMAWTGTTSPFNIDENC